MISTFTFGHFSDYFITWVLDSLTFLTPTLILLQWLHGKKSACISGAAGDVSSIPGLGRSPGEGNGNPLQYSCLENPMDRGAWWATVHGVAKSQTGLKQLSVQSASWLLSSSAIILPEVVNCVLFICRAGGGRGGRGAGREWNTQPSGLCSILWVWLEN